MSYFAVFIKDGSLSMELTITKFTNVATAIGPRIDGISIPNKTPRLKFTLVRGSIRKPQAASPMVPAVEKTPDIFTDVMVINVLAVTVKFAIFECSSITI
jgi:hypothetical protein